MPAPATERGPGGILIIGWGTRIHNTVLSGYKSLGKRDEYTTLYYQDTCNWARDKNKKHSIIRILVIGQDRRIHGTALS